MKALQLVRSPQPCWSVQNSGKQPLTCLLGAEAESENQAESMPAPGAEEPQSCCPIYMLQYLPSGQGPNPKPVFHLS